MSALTFVRFVLKPAIFVAALGPASLLAWQAWRGTLGANPVETLTHQTGLWALRFLLITLAVTPVRRVTGWVELVRCRRMLGLWAFFYAGCHFAVYIALDQAFGFDYIAEDIAERPYITVGFTGLVLLVPLALTSSAGMIRRLGGRRWRRLHRLVYASALCGVVHYLWLVKADIRHPLAYGAVLAVLLGARAWFALQRKVLDKQPARVVS